MEFIKNWMYILYFSMLLLFLYVKSRAYGPISIIPDIMGFVSIFVIVIILGAYWSRTELNFEKIEKHGDQVVEWANPGKGSLHDTKGAGLLQRIKIIIAGIYLFLIVMAVMFRCMAIDIYFDVAVLMDLKRGD